MAKKLTVNMIAMGNLKHRKKQYVSLVVGIMLAMVFSSAIPLLFSCYQSSIAENRIRHLGKQTSLVLHAENIDAEGIKPFLKEPAGWMHITGYGWTENPDQSAAFGWLDEQAQKLYYLQFEAGRYPEKPGEIAVEENLLLRLLPDAEIGDTVTFHVCPENGKTGITSGEEKTFTLVGILRNRLPFLEEIRETTLSDEEKQSTAKVIPAAFVSSEEPLPHGSSEGLIALLNEKVPGRPWEMHILDKAEVLDTWNVYTLRTDDIATGSGLSIFFASLLALLTCFGIANTVYSSFRERKQQIGMLRAVGATTWQVMHIFLREALLLAVFCIPLSLLTAWFGVKLFAQFMGESFWFYPRISVLLAGGFLGVVCVLLSAFFPLLGVVAVSPMHAIRDTEKMRTLKRRKIRSRNHFDASRLIAGRKNMFRRGFQIGLLLILVLTTIICSEAAAALSFSQKSYRENQMNEDYKINPIHNYQMFSTSGINLRNEADLLSEGDRQTILEIPEIREVYGAKRVQVNLILEEELPDYLKLHNLYSSLSFYGVKSLDISSDAVVTKENVWDLASSEYGQEYTSQMEAAGYGSNVFSTHLIAQSQRLLPLDGAKVLEGEIHMDRLDAGEEVLLNAPPVIGFLWNRSPDNGGFMGLYDMRPESIQNMSPLEKRKLQYLLAEAESPFHAGDTLTMSITAEDENGNLIRKDRNVRIGAILVAPGPFQFLTTLEGLDKFGFSFDYETLYGNLAEECTAEVDAQICKQLEAEFPKHAVYSAYSRMQARKEQYLISASVFFSLISVLFTICISILNNSISAQIREEKRTIGIMRAVGADRWVIIKSYVLEILGVSVLGPFLGCILYGIYDWVQLTFFMRFSAPFVSLLTALLLGIAVVLCGFINLSVQVKKVSKFSIVENIREL